jgi:hypothetical protein
MSRADRIALLLSLLAVVVTYLVADRVFERMAHIEDEMAFVWQAQAIARGKLTLPSPPGAQSFVVPFVVDYQGQRFGKYPLGWPVLLAIGIRLGIRSWINPLLAGLAVWLTYRLGKRTFGETVGLLAAGLTITSPFYLMNSGSLLSHPFGLVLSAAFALAWLDAFCQPVTSQRWLPTLVAALTLGMLALTRPLTAIAVGLPFGVHGLFLLVRGDWATRRRVFAIGAISLAMGSLLFLWQYAVTGNALLNPYTLWWSYDRVGFGPGYGVTPGGHTLQIAIFNTRVSLQSGNLDLFGWFRLSSIFLPFGLLAMVRKPRPAAFLTSAALVGSVFPSLVLVYLSYWIGSYLFGPRYFYEGLYSLTIFSAAGIALLAGWPIRPGESWPAHIGWQRPRSLAVTGLLTLLVCINLAFYLPTRLGGMFALYGIQRSQLAPFLSPQAQQDTPALVIVHPDIWTTYAAFLELEDAQLDTPFIFIHTRGKNIDAQFASLFPGRKIFHYYPDQPYLFYTAPLPQP